MSVWKERQDKPYTSVYQILTPHGPYSMPHGPYLMPHMNLAFCFEKFDEEELKKMQTIKSWKDKDCEFSLYEGDVQTKLYKGTKPYLIDGSEGFFCESKSNLQFVECFIDRHVRYNKKFDLEQVLPKKFVKDVGIEMNSITQSQYILAFCGLPYVDNMQKALKLNSN